MASLRSRLEKSQTLASAVGWLLTFYLRLCQRTIKWEHVGVDALKEELQDGPVVVVLWHGRSLMGPIHWPVEAGQLSTLYADSVIGRVAGSVQRQAGLRPMPFHERNSNLVVSRTVMKRAKEGVSIGLTGDGPLGPALQVKDAPLQWARAVQRPVWVYAFGTSRGRELGSWDSMWLPSPFGRGRIVFERLPIDIPRKAEEMEPVREAITAALNSATEKARTF